MYCTFCGHSNKSYYDIYDQLKTEIIKMADRGVTTFFSGGYGDFDLTCIAAVGEIKKDFPRIKNYIVLAYRDETHISKYEFICNRYNAETLYTLEDYVIPKFAITQRNKWMVDNSDYMIAFVDYTWGGAYTTLKYAKRKNSNILKIINLADAPIL